MTNPSFDSAALLEIAADAEGLQDFGPDDFRDGLRVLCETYGGQPFHEKARRRHHRRLVSLLTTRLRIQAAFRAHPEIQRRAIRTPPSAPTPSC